ncbi:phosphoribosylglycinamide formyltransferase [Nocardia sp. NPDC050378]|uniref:phosphoribosylglycinamide formyltransferase n=1 Tax=Nocardia sp. NPDC050378 TaxID=3155400 RepID=UPI0034034142
MPDHREARVAVLASGVGAGLAAIRAAGVPVAVVLVDRPCPATDIAAGYGIPVELVRRQPNREQFTRSIVTTLVRHDIDLVVIAGFMSILGRSAFVAFPDRVLNFHPSLLPAFRGANAVADALRAGATVTGATVHIATERVDDGPILAQEPVPILPGDSVESLTRRIQAVEHRLYPETIHDFIGRPTELSDSERQAAERFGP